MLITPNRYWTHQNPYQITFWPLYEANILQLKGYEINLSTQTERLTLHRLISVSATRSFVTLVSFSYAHEPNARLLRIFYTTGYKYHQVCRI